MDERNYVWLSLEFHGLLALSAWNFTFGQNCSPLIPVFLPFVTNTKKMNGDNPEECVLASR
jgi:hypothetical protein